MFYFACSMNGNNVTIWNDLLVDLFPQTWRFPSCHYRISCSVIQVNKSKARLQLLFVYILQANVFGSWQKLDIWTIQYIDHIYQHFNREFVTILIRISCTKNRRLFDKHPNVTGVNVNHIKTRSYEYFPICHLVK